MKNKKVGWIIVGIAGMISVIVLIFNLGLKKIVEQTCAHGVGCSMYDTIALQTWISVSITGIILAIGIAIMNTKPEEKVIVKTKKQRKKKKDKSKLEDKEKEIVGMLEKENGAIFQKTIMEKLDIGKVGITRLLDKLESKQFVERKRRGMNNIVVLKN